MKRFLALSAIAFSMLCVAPPPASAQEPVSASQFPLDIDLGTFAASTNRPAATTRSSSYSGSTGSAPASASKASTFLIAPVAKFAVQTNDRQMVTQPTVDIKFRRPPKFNPVPSPGAYLTFGLGLLGLGLQGVKRKPTPKV